MYSWIKMQRASLHKKTAVVGMSGGVDSSVTAAMLKEQGFDVIGVFMKNWSEDSAACTWAEDAEDARKVAKVLNIPFYVWNFEKEYKTRVVEYFLREYKAGRTPNPDVMCNSEIKFKVFLEKALSVGADYVATGHYARIRKVRYQISNIKYQLLKGIDPAKDQSYFLYTLKQEQLGKIIFPIGGYKKQEIRKLAKKFSLPNAEKKDSQGICFIGKINVTKFLKEHIQAKAGTIVTANGQVIGKHSGLPFYTIGQREGIGIGGTGPYYVVSKNFKANKLIVTNNSEDIKLWRKNFTVTNVTWVSGKAPKLLKTGVTIRYHHPEYSASIKKISDIRYQISFEKPQRAITVGQAAVIYRADELLGGGVIEKVV